MSDTVVTSSESGANAAGWIIAIALILGVAFFGIFVWPGMRGVAPLVPASARDVDMRLPNGSSMQTENPDEGAMQ